MRNTISTTIIAGVSALGLIGALGACSSSGDSKVTTAGAPAWVPP